MLSPEEFARLQKLACIKLSPEEEQKLGAQLSNIIKFLDQLNEIKIDKNLKTKSNLTLRTISGTKKFADTKKLLANVKHPIVNNSIVIKSVLS